MIWWHYQKNTVGTEGGNCTSHLPLFIYLFIHGVKVIFWTSGRDNLLHWQMPNCVNCSQSTISLNVRHRCCLLLLNPFCISAFFSFSQQVQKKKKGRKEKFHSSPIFDVSLLALSLGLIVYWKNPSGGHFLWDLELNTAWIQLLVLFYT